MWLDGPRFLGLGENFQQFIIGKEIEAGKSRTFGLQIVIQTLLYSVQQFVRLLEVSQQFLIGTQEGHTMWLAVGSR